MEDKILKFYCKVPTPNVGLEKEVKKLFCEFIFDADMASKGKGSSVTEVYNTFKNRLDVLDNRWKDEVKRIAIRGNKTKRMFVSSLSNDVRLYKIIEKKFDFIWLKDYRLISYTNDKFREVMFMEISMMIAKYEFVYEYEVMAAAMHLLFNYFKIIEMSAVGYEWTFTPYELNQLVNDIKENDSSLLSKYYDIMVKTVERKEPKVVHYKKQKPQSASDLFIGFKGATRADFVRYCAQTWDVTQMTVGRWIKKFGITDEMILENADQEEQLNSVIEKQQKKLEEQQQKVAEEQKKLAEAQQKLEEYRMSKTIKNS